jgi:UPF0271 protein
VVTVDLSADAGEKATDHADEDVLIELVTSVSVACGFHAGDPATMRRTVETAVRHGVTVGAHPSYLDREGFGRRPLDVAPARIADDVLYQLGALDAMARASGTRVRYVKPHGALYHRVDVDDRCARAVAEAARVFGDLTLVASAGSAARLAALHLGVAVAAEAFADRGYLADGRLAPRTSPGAVLTHPEVAARQAVSLATEGVVTALDGTKVTVAAASICVHGDTPGALSIARAVRAALEAAGVTIAPFAP